MAKRKNIADAFGGSFKEEPERPEEVQEPRKQVNAQVPVSLQRRFKAKASAEGTTMSALMVQWIEEYLAGER